MGGKALVVETVYTIELPRVPLPEGIAPSEASTVPDAGMTPSNSINRELAGLVKRRRGRIQNESQENSWNDGNFKCMLGACTLCCCSLVLGLVIFGALAHGGSVCEDALACENLPPGVAAIPNSTKTGMAPCRIAMLSALV